MKRLIATFADDAQIDVTSLLSQSIDFKIETVNDGKKPKKTVHRDPKMNIQQCVMQHYLHGGNFTLDDAKKWMVKCGFNKNSASPAISTLAGQGNLKKVSTGVFAFAKPLK